MSKEEFFISHFANPFIGDDGVVIDEYVYSSDSFFENVHFKRDWMSLYQIAVKSMLVNISDAIAMNAVPKYALLNIAMPNLSRKEMSAFAQGFLDVTKRYNMQIIGGDTIKNNKIDISVTIVAKTKKPIFRKEIKPNYLIAYTGNVGSVKKDLTRLLRGGCVGAHSKFITPILRDKFFYEASPYIASAMDISDGIYTDLERLSTQSGVGFRLLKKLPKDIGCSGEEYELLFAFDKRYLAKILAIAKKHRLALTVFAKAVRKGYTNRCKANHF